MLDLITSPTSSGTRSVVIGGGIVGPTTTLIMPSLEPFLEGSGADRVYGLIVGFIETGLWLIFGYALLHDFFGTDKNPTE